MNNNTLKTILISVITTLLVIFLLNHLILLFLLVYLSIGARAAYHNYKEYGANEFMFLVFLMPMFGCIVHDEVLNGLNNDVKYVLNKLTNNKKISFKFQVPVIIKLENK